MRPTWLGSVLAIVLLAAPLRAGAAGRPGGSPTTCDGSWSIVPSPNAVQSDNILRAVATIGPSDVWAVGLQLPHGLAEPLAEHWNGTQWTIVPTPPVGEADLLGVTAISSSDVWAVGSRRVIPATPVTFHWDGSTWSVVPTPKTPEDTVLLAVSAVSSSDVWAVGMQRHLGPERAMAMHWDGAAWTIVHTPSRRERNTELVSVDAIATDDVWAVGNAYGRDVVPVALHWNGEHWREREPPVLEREYLDGVSGTGPNDVWAVGVSGDEAESLTLHWDGSGWSVVSSPNPRKFGDSVWGIDAGAPDLAWAVGSYPDGFRVYPYVLKWDGTSWTVMPAPARNPNNVNYLYAVGADSATDAWAVGDYFDTDLASHRTLTEHWCT